MINVKRSIFFIYFTSIIVTCNQLIPSNSLYRYVEPTPAIIKEVCQNIKYPLRYVLIQQIGQYIKIEEKNIFIDDVIDQSDNSFFNSEEFQKLAKLVNNNKATKEQVLFYLFLLIDGKEYLKNTPQILEKCQIIKSNQSVQISKLQARYLYNNLITAYYRRTFAFSDTEKLYKIIQDILVEEMNIKSIFNISLFSNIDERWFNPYDRFYSCVKASPDNFKEIKQNLIKSIVYLLSLPNKDDYSVIIYQVNCYIAFINIYEDVFEQKFINTLEDLDLAYMIQYREKAN
jgi:hypothetical protein